MIGFSELLLVLVFATLVLGPERLPGVVKSWVRTLATWKAELQGASAEFAQELSLPELQRELEQVRAELDSLRRAPDALVAEVSRTLDGEPTPGRSPEAVTDTESGSDQDA
jgi:sec-independent protein translocase protein TatB